MNDLIWELAESRPEAEKLAAEVRIPLAIAQVLVNRRITDAASADVFLHGSLDSLRDPYLMTGMTLAVDRIFRAKAAGERILIFGDYDVDGILSVVMLHKALTSLGAAVDFFIPERLTEGYGIKDEHIAVVEEKKARLVISVDCGIKAQGFVRKAKERGVDVIVTDHHRPGEGLPEAVAILNPVLEGANYPERTLAGVGVVFKLIQALLARDGKSEQARHYLKLVAIGTIADIVELRGENRLFVKSGLRGLENIANVGLRSLIKESGIKGRITEADVGFRIGPRINAAGRMGRTQLALDLFFAESAERAEAIARELGRLNARRQAAEDKIYGEAFDRIRTRAWDQSYKILITGSEDWHRGVIGIVASRLKDAFHRPVILFSYEDSAAVGSGRSIPEFSLIQCLDECREHFRAYGGHEYAVGCTLDRNHVPAFKQAANAVAAERLSDDALKRKLAIDAKVELSAIDGRFCDLLALLGPFGVGNPRPRFLAEGVKVAAPPRILKDKHLKLELRHHETVFKAIGWDKSSWAEQFGEGDRMDAVFSLQTSSYLGNDELYLSLEDVRPAESS